MKNLSHIGGINIDNISLHKKTKDTIKEYNFHFKKSLGQNFLVDSKVISKIIKGANLQKDDLIIEIGPGIGTVTSEIAKYVKKVISIEIDSSLIPILKNNLKDYNNIEIINKDFLKINLYNIISKYNFNKIKVVANLPYYIATHIITNIIKLSFIDSLVIMVQKEVADRIIAKPKNKSYGSLSLFLQYYSKISILANVPKNCFIPRPKVNSTIIYLQLNKKNYNIDETLLFKIIKLAFSKRRKTLINCIYNTEIFNLTKKELINIFSLCNFKENIRGEELTLNDFIILTKEIKKIKANL